MENGYVVYGSEPDFEECKIAAKLSEDFMTKIMKCEIAI